MNIYEHAMLSAINAARTSRGVHALRHDDRLASAAYGHAVDLSRTPGLLHVGSDGSSIDERLRREGYQPTFWREVVGWGWDGRIEPMVQWWLDSPAHAAIVLDANVTDIGVGYVVAPGSVWGYYWCVDFAAGDSRVEPPPPAPPRPYTSHVPIVVGGTVAAPATIDLLPYLCGDGRAYMVRHPDGNSEKFRTVRDGARFLLLKNNQWEQLWADDAYIWRGVDTSPGDGQYYRQFEDGQRGARWCPRQMTIGQRWESPVEHTVQTYWKGDCQPAEHHRNGRTRNRLTLIARHEAMTWNGVTVRDVIEVVSGTGETGFWGRGYGLVAWASPWGSSAISHELPAHEADNQPERGCFG
jgi:hypothetical protein